MTGPDELLLDRLRRIAAEVDGVPDLVGESARAALTTRRIDAELAELVLDSAAGPSAVRSGDEQPRVLAFEVPAVSIEIQLHEGPGARSIRGLVAGPATEVAVQTAAGHRVTVLDPEGWFAVPDLPPGAFRLRVLCSDGAAVLTSWVS